MPEKWEGTAEECLRRIVSERDKEIKRLLGKVRTRTAQRNKIQKEIDDMRKMEGVLKLPILKTA